MDVKAIMSVVILAGVAVGVTFWLGGESTSDSATSQKVHTGLDDDRGAPPPDEEGPRPKAVTEKTLFEFGSMEKGETQQHKFLIKNEGEDTLVIAKGASTCKCTVSDLPSNEIPPGESAEVNLEWTPKSNSKLFSQTARIWTNDADRPSIDFRVEGEVSALFNLVPGAVVDAGNVLEETGVKTRLVIFSGLADSMTELEVSYAGDRLTFQIEELAKKDLQEFDAKVGQVINIQVAPTVPVGAHKEIIEVDFKINGKDVHQEVAIQFDRRGPVTIIPVLPGTIYRDSVSLVNFERFPAEKGKKQSVTVMIDDPPNGEEIEMTVKDNQFTKMKISIEPNRQLALNRRQAFNVTFEIPPGLPPLDYGRANPLNVILHTTHPVVDEIKLYIELHSN